MLLTQKLIGYFNSVFDKDAKSFAAFRIRHESGAFRWRVADRVFTGFNGDTELFSVVLDGHTIRSLLEHLAALPGVTVTSNASSEQLGLSACALIDGDGTQALSNGDRVDAFTSLLWAYLESLAGDLKEARRQIDEALRQMSIKTAEAGWLDEWGGYFGVPRDNGEADADYATRIISEVRRPRGNNKAIEIGLLDQFGQASQVIDLQRFGGVYQPHNGEITHDSLNLYGAISTPYYGLFKIVIGYDLLGGLDVSGYVAEVQSYVERLRDAGTHLESIELSGSYLGDTFMYSPSDAISIPFAVAVTEEDAFSGVSSEVMQASAALAQLSDVPSAGEDVALMAIETDFRYSGLRHYDGAIDHLGGSTWLEPIGNDGDPTPLYLFADGSINADGLEEADGII